MKPFPLTQRDTKVWRLTGIEPPPYAPSRVVLAWVRLESVVLDLEGAWTEFALREDWTSHGGWKRAGGLISRRDVMVARWLQAAMDRPALAAFGPTFGHVVYCFRGGGVFLDTAERLVCDKQEQFFRDANGLSKGCVRLFASASQREQERKLSLRVLERLHRYRLIGSDPVELEFIWRLAKSFREGSAERDNLPLVYADWLEERGDVRSEWIRRWL